MARGRRGDGRGPGRGRGSGRGQPGRGTPTGTLPLSFISSPHERAREFQRRMTPEPQRRDLYRSIRPTTAFTRHLLRYHRDRDTAMDAYQGATDETRPIPPSHFGGAGERGVSHRIADTVAHGNYRFNRGNLLFDHQHPRQVGYAWRGEAPRRWHPPQALGHYERTNSMQAAFDQAALDESKRGYGFLSAYPIPDPYNPHITEFSSSDDEGNYFPPPSAPFSAGISSAALRSSVEAAARKVRQSRRDDPRDLARGPMGDRFGGGRGPGRGGPPPPPPTAPQQLVIAARGGSIRSPRPSAKRTQDDKMQQFFDDLMAGKKKKRY